MRITLSYVWTDEQVTVHPGGATVDVDDLTGRTLINDGHARLADPAPVQEAAVTATSSAQTGEPGESGDTAQSTADSPPAGDTVKE